MVTLNEKSRLDVAIDGADDVDPQLCLVKGGGGALLREKMVEVMADKFICIVDESKLSKGLGPNFPLPVEITPFCYEHTRKVIENLPSVKGCRAVLRKGSVINNKPGMRHYLSSTYKFVTSSIPIINYTFRWRKYCCHRQWQLYCRFIF